jgi:hypothetical protein
MSALSAVLAPNPDGTLHVPIPENWIQQGVKAVLIKADIEPLGEISGSPNRAKDSRVSDVSGGRSHYLLISTNRLRTSKNTQREASP